MTKQRFVGLAAGMLLGGMALVAAAQDAPIPRADTVVKSRALVSLQPAPRNATVEVAVVAEILKGFHVNSNTPREDYLIPTTLTPQVPAGLKVLETAYPKGEVQKFGFSETPLDVYDGTITIKMKVQVAADAPTGAAKLPMILRYQACNDVACLPPVKMPVVADLQIAEAGAKAVAQHPNVFGKSRTK